MYTFHLQLSTDKGITYAEYILCAFVNRLRYADVPLTGTYVNLNVQTCSINAVVKIVTHNM